MKHCIFVLEDNKEIRELIAFLLTRNGYDVQCFENAGDFYKRIKEEQPDLFILDVMLPDGDGVVICKTLKADEKTKDIPVLLMSANARRENIERSGAQDFIAKPFDINNFMTRIQKQIA